MPKIDNDDENDDDDDDDDDADYYVFSLFQRISNTIGTRGRWVRGGGCNQQNKLLQKCVLI